MEEKILVTGANGFIGSHVVRTLLAQNRPVRCFVQKNSDMRNLTGLDVEIREGDLRDEETIFSSLKGCRVLYHLAAYNNLWSPNKKLPFEINVNGTCSLMDGAVKHGISKVLYTSSATLYRSKNGKPASEESYIENPPVHNAYEQSKYLAEEKAFQYLKEGIEVLSLAPTAPIGAGDVNLTGPGQLIVHFLRGKLPAFLESGFNVVDVEVLAKAFVNSEQKGKSGERYILGGENITFGQLFAELAKITNLRAPKVRVPYGLAFGVAWMQEKVADWITHKPPMAPLEGVRLAKKPCYYQCQKAQSELGLGKTQVPQALEKAVSWFRKEGYCS